MGMNKQKGNMYPFVTHTWNPIRGKCPHDCVYCYMKVYPQSELHFAEKEMQTNLGQGNFIFVGSSTDMWADVVPDEWIDKVLKHCRDNYAYNQYLFQSKNPRRFATHIFPDGKLLGTTIETNRDYGISLAPMPSIRYQFMKRTTARKMVSIEPIIDFDLVTLVDWIRQIAPDFVSIGADSKGHNLPEPLPEKVNALIEELSKFTAVKLKDNLKRLRQKIK